MQKSAVGFPRTPDIFSSCLTPGQEPITIPKFMPLFSDSLPLRSVFPGERNRAGISA